LQTALPEDMEPEGYGLRHQLRRWARMPGKPDAVDFKGCDDADVARFRAREKALAALYGGLKVLGLGNQRLDDLLRPLRAVLVDEFGPNLETNYPLGLLHQWARTIDKAESDSLGQSTGVQLLTALREIYAEHKNAEWLETDVILLDLAGRKEEPWSEYRHGKPINYHDLAKLLGEFGVRSARERPEDSDKQRRGYRLRDLQDAFRRYLPPFSPDASHASHASQEDQADNRN
jgi:hypothetical protein